MPSLRRRSTPRLLVVGLAPGLKGANRTGRPFTGDYAGDLLYATLLEVRLRPGQLRGAIPTTGCALVDCRITNAVRCVPPENKPLPAEIAACRPFLQAEIAAMPNAQGDAGAGHDRARPDPARAGVQPAGAYPFSHGALHELPTGLHLADSYHCSRYNTNTGRLTTAMFHDVFRTIRTVLAP